ncbi:MAG: transaldolase family protein [Nitrospinota bacterium]|nr:transaldolase family protein [Nitrospinota bacterium]
MGTISKDLSETIHRIAFQEITPGKPSQQYSSDPLLARLKELGTELWIDTGELELAQSVWKNELTALTTNNTLANQVVQSGVMDDVIQETVDKLGEAASGLSQEELVMEIGFVINCRIALRLVEAFKVKVSVELHPSISRNIEKSVAYGKRYYRVCPEYFTVKVPLTPEGLLATRRIRQEKIPVNFTLGFSARQNYLAARLANPNYVNVFLGRLNAVVADNSAGSGEWVGEKVTLHTQNAVYEVRDKHTDVKTRLIAASIRNGDQVATLAGMDVHTIPPKAMKEFQESGRTPAQIKKTDGTALKPNVDPGHDWSDRVADLWEVDGDFRQAVDRLMIRNDLDQLSGEDLMQFCNENGLDLFHPFSRKDLKKIQDHGKIPKLADWPGSVALDDLMTQSALQSFAKDQNALDARIQSFLK